MKKTILSFFLLCLTVIVFAQDALIWQVEYPGKPGKLYLAGTIHMGSPDMFPLDSVYDKIFSESDTLAFEMLENPTEKVEIMKAMMKRSNVQKGTPNLQKRLGEDDYDLLLAHLKKTGFTKSYPEKHVLLFRSWFIFFVVRMLECEENGCSAKYGWENVFREHAGKKNMVELENAFMQLSILSDMKLDEEITEELRRTVRDPEKTTAEFKEQVQAFKDCNASEMAKDNEKTKKESPLLYQSVIANRNPAMADKLFAMLDKNQVVMALVGCSHYVGDDSINALLIQKGCKITRLKKTGKKGSLMPGIMKGKTSGQEI